MLGLLLELLRLLRLLRLGRLCRSLLLLCSAIRTVPAPAVSQTAEPAVQASVQPTAVPEDTVRTDTVTLQTESAKAFYEMMEADPQLKAMMEKSIAKAHEIISDPALYFVFMM